MKNISKCVVLARGLGKRMRADDPAAPLDSAQAAFADAGIKAMVPVGRPFLDYELSALADGGYERACLVIGPEHDAIREYYTETIQPTRIAVEFAVQDEPIGTANAVLAAEAFTGDDEFLVLNGDNYYPPDVLVDVQRLGAPGTVLFDAGSLVTSSNIPTERISAFASCTVNDDGFLTDIQEKPASFVAGAVKLVSMNCWRFGRAIFDACRDVPLSPRGEYELPIAVRMAIKRGMKLRATISHSGVLDLSRRSDVATVAERLKDVQVSL